VLNSRAAAFYKRHGVKEIGLAAEAGADLSGKPLMVMKYCVRRRLGLCKKGKEVEPLHLEDAEGHSYRLEFDCARCVMKLYFDSTKPEEDDTEE